MSDRVNVGVIGVGHWGKNLLRSFGDLGALAAFCDADRGRLQEFVPKYDGARAYQRAEDLLADEGVDAVAIATPAGTHGKLVEQALSAGKQVYCEKPLCLDLAQAERLKAEADRLGLTLMVGHILLYHPAFRELLRRVREGDLGRLRYVYSTRLSLGRLRRDESALWSFAPHDISMILELAGSMPESVVASGGHYLTPGVADTTLSHFTFSDNLQAHIFVSWLHPFKDQRLVVVGEDAMVVFDDVVPAPKKLVMYRHGLTWDGSLPVVSKAEAEPLPFEDSEPLRNECRAFLDAVTRKAPFPSDAAEGIRVMRVLHACHEAITTGERVILGGGTW